MKRILPIVGFLMFTLFGTMAQAQDSNSTAYLQKACQAAVRIDVAQAAGDTSQVPTLDYVNSMYCIGYVNGVRNALAGADFVGSDGQVYTLVYPTDIGTEQVYRVFLKYVEAHPEELNKASVITVFEALVDADLIEKQAVKRSTSSAPTA